MLRFSKALYLIFIFYICIYQSIIGIIPFAPIILGGAMVLCLFTYILSQNYKVSFIMEFSCSLFFIFFMYCFFTGAFVSIDKSEFIDSILTYLQSIILIFYIVIVSKISNSCNFFIYSFLPISLIYGAKIIFNGVKVNNYVSISESLNPNTAGIVMLIGIFMIIYIAFSKLNGLSLALSFIGIIFLTYAITITASRKSLIAAIVTIAAWIIITIARNWMRFSGLQKFGILVLFGIIAIFIIIFFIPFFVDSNIYKRLFSDTTNQGDENRIKMYAYAVELFNEHPLFGIGYDQFKVVYGVYSHSLYAELISCTGFFGTILYFTAYISVIIKQLKLFLRTKDIPTKNRAIMLALMLVIMLFLGAGVILYYTIQINIFIAIVISFYTINIKGENISDGLQKNALTPVEEPK